MNALNADFKVAALVVQKFIKQKEVKPINSQPKKSIIVLPDVTKKIILITKDNINNTSIAIHEIPTAELDSYVSNNEWMADAEMQTEFNKLGLNLDIDIRSKDSID